MNESKMYSGPMQATLTKSLDVPQHRINSFRKAKVKSPLLLLYQALWNPITHKRPSKWQAFVNSRWTFYSATIALFLGIRWIIKVSGTKFTCLAQFTCSHHFFLQLREPASLENTNVMR